MRQILILKSDAAPPDGCTPTTGAPPGYQAWTREVRAPKSVRLVALPTLLAEIEEATEREVATLAARDLRFTLPLDLDISAIASQLDALPESDDYADDAEILRLLTVWRLMDHILRVISLREIDYEYVGRATRPEPLLDGAALLAEILEPAIQRRHADRAAAEHLVAEVARMKREQSERRAGRGAFTALPLTAPYDTRKTPQRSEWPAERDARLEAERDYAREREDFEIERLNAALVQARNAARAGGFLARLRAEDLGTSATTWMIDLLIRAHLVTGTIEERHLDDAAILAAIADVSGAPVEDLTPEAADLLARAGYDGVEVRRVGVPEDRRLANVIDLRRAEIRERVAADPHLAARLQRLRDLFAAA